MSEQVRYITNEQGERVGVLLDLEAYNRFLAYVLFIQFLGRRDAYPTSKKDSCGMDILPVPTIYARDDHEPSAHNQG